jgi:single-stranded-DNA-specific exonuclease
MIPPIWERQTADPADVDRLSRALGLEPVIARLLAMRGLTDPDAAARFLKPSLDQLHDPSLLAGLPEAMARIRQALASGERIAIHGDYDVDGITSTVILRRTLELLGGNVGHFIPDRLKDGYGLQPATIDRLHAEGAKLVISVDCGIRGEDAALARASWGSTSSSPTTTSLARRCRRHSP